MMATVFPAPSREFRRPMSNSVLRPLDDLSDDDSLTPLSSSSDDEAPVPQSEAEKTREQELLQDSMAIVLSPYLVRCRTCGSKIKLSMKSLFDGYHWRTHRIRCLKKHLPASDPPALKKRIRKLSKAKVKAKERINFNILRLRPPSPSRPSSEDPDTRVRTPSLEQDSERESIPMSPDSPLDYHDSSSSPLSMKPILSPNPDAVFEEYIFRTHGKKTQPFISTRWQDWSWDQLLVPQFVLDLDFVPHISLEGDLDCDDDSI